MGKEEEKKTRRGERCSPDARRTGVAIAGRVEKRNPPPPLPSAAPKVRLRRIIPAKAGIQMAGRIANGQAWIIQRQPTDS